MIFLFVTGFYSYLFELTSLEFENFRFREQNLNNLHKTCFYSVKSQK